MNTYWIDNFSYWKDHAKRHGIEWPGGEVEVADPTGAEVVGDDFLHCQLICDMCVDTLLEQADRLLVPLDRYGPIIE